MCCHGNTLHVATIAKLLFFSVYTQRTFYLNLVDGVELSLYYIFSTELVNLFNFCYRKYYNINRINITKSKEFFQFGLLIQ